MHGESIRCLCWKADPLLSARSLIAPIVFESTILLPGGPPHLAELEANSSDAQGKDERGVNDSDAEYAYLDAVLININLVDGFQKIVPFPSL